MNLWQEKGLCTKKERDKEKGKWSVGGEDIIGSFTHKKPFAFKCEQKKFYFGAPSEKNKSYFASELLIII